MNVYTNGNDLVVAESKADASECLETHVGDTCYESEQEWEPVPEDEEISLCVNELGSVCDPSDYGAVLTMPAAAWVLKEGRGYLGSEDT